MPVDVSFLLIPAAAAAVLVVVKDGRGLAVAVAEDRAVEARSLLASEGAGEGRYEGVGLLAGCVLFFTFEEEMERVALSEERGRGKLGLADDADSVVADLDAWTDAIVDVDVDGLALEEGKPAAPAGLGGIVPAIVEVAATNEGGCATLAEVERGIGSGLDVDADASVGVTGVTVWVTAGAMPCVFGRALDGREAAVE